ncbi:hypothetical protein [Roseibium sp. RKSG952]|uniref:hypothetical protein n=1 Tax=Roseibium sp. RKSG952 TaxID=2529384 RepID=UPI0012BD6BAC|nr:hypothetical protein [Roseibium sp. RKSG952]MTI00951.1 hypothetical protein [Roseibium sp. RKSG952]
MKKALVVLSFLGLTLLLGYQSFQIIKFKHQRNRNASFREFYENSVEQVCLSKEAVIEAAVAQGFWYVQEGATALEPFDAPVPIGTVDLVKVHIKPDPFLAPRVFTTFSFGEDGCWIVGE